MKNRPKAPIDSCFVLAPALPHTPHAHRHTLGFCHAPLAISARDPSRLRARPQPSPRAKPSSSALLVEGDLATRDQEMFPVSNSVLAFTLTAAVLFSSADAATYTYTAGSTCGSYNTAVTVQNTDTWRCCSSTRAKGVEYRIDPDESEDAYHTANVYILDTGLERGAPQIGSKMRGERVGYRVHWRCVLL